MSSAVFFDRDGTLIKDKHYLDDPGDVEWFEGAFRTIRNLKQQGYRVIVVTNQSGVARGKFTEADVKAIHQRMRDDLAEVGLTPDAFYYCPYLPEAKRKKYRKSSPLRKPNPGMLLKARDRYSLTLCRSYMVGDRYSDVEAGNRAGCRTILLRTGKSDGRNDDDETESATPDTVLDSVAEVGSYIQNH